MTRRGFGLLAWAAIGRADERSVRAEANLEKRARLALNEAEAAERAARDAYAAGNLKATAARLEEVARFCELAWQSLQETRKDPRRNPKHFKYAEITMRMLLRKLEALEQSMDAADRGMVEPVRERVRKANDEILKGIMEKRS